jgi:hypothetical protein
MQARFPIAPPALREAHDPFPYLVGAAAPAAASRGA